MTSKAVRQPFGLPFYYGWTIVAAAFMTTFVSNGMAFWSLQVFIGPMQADTGWVRAEIMGALTLRWIVGGFGGLLAGPFFDRKRGPMIITLLGALIDGGSMMALFWAQDALQFTLLFGIVGGVGSIGTGRLIAGALLPKWFVAKRGVTMGIAAAGSGISALFMGPLANAVCDAAGWRMGWVWMGALTLILILPLAPLVRRAPEDVGLLPDNGETAPTGPAGRVRPTASSERSYTLPEALRSPEMWMLTLAMSVGLFSTTTNVSSMGPFFQSLGFSAQVAVWGMAVYGVSSFFSRFIWGALADRVTARQALLLQTICSAVGVALYLSITNETMLYIVAAYHGLALGGFLVLQPIIWPAYFGRMHIGAITGVTQFLTTFAMAAGPLFAGAMFDATGAYTWAYRTLIATWLLCTVLTFIVRPVRQQASADAAVTSS